MEDGEWRMESRECRSSGIILVILSQCNYRMLDPAEKGSDSGPAGSQHIIRSIDMRYAICDMRHATW